MTILYRTIIFPRCKENYLLIAINKEIDRLYLCCSECMAAWNNIEDAKNNKNMFVDSEENSTDATADDIKRHDWKTIVSGEIKA